MRIKTSLIIGLIITLMMITTSLSAKLEVESYVDNTTIGIEDLLKYTIEISGSNAGSIKTPKLPRIANLIMLNSSSSSSQNITIVNGKMEKNNTKTFTYTLRPQKVGKALIPPITINHKGDKVVTSPIRITIVEGSREPAPPTSSRLRNQKQSSEKVTDNLFITIDLDKSNVYEDEPVIVNYQFYTKYDIANLSFGDIPTFNDFWKEDIYRISNIKYKQQTKNGELYNTMLLLSVALYPTKNGKLVIPPLEMLVDIRTKSKSFFDFGSTKRYSIKSKSRVLNVKPLPEKNQPPSFNGAVGSFQLEADISDSKLKVGDSFTYSLSIFGRGNIQHFDAPQLPDISNLRFIDPEINNELDNNKISGRKTIKYLVIAQEKGEFELPGLSFTYFDTNQKRYITKRTPSFNISVEEGDLTYVTGGRAQSQVLREGKDIGFIIKGNKLRTTVLYFNSFFYWILVILLFISIPVVTSFANEKYKLMDNYDYKRQKSANKILKKYMKQATQHYNTSNEGFYPAAQNGLQNYLSDKLKINRGSSTEDLLAKVSNHSVDEDLLADIKAFFQQCNQVRFMPGGFNSEQMKDHYEKLQYILSTLSKVRF